MTTLATTPAVPDVNEMKVVHRVFRREFAAIPALVRGVADGDVARARVVGDHLALVLAGLTLHHTGEDEVLWPLLRRRASPSTGLVETMEAQHGRVEERAARVERTLTAWRSRPEASRGEDCAAAVEAMAADLVEHLDLEEREILPLVTAHISVAEWNSLGEHGKEGHVAPAAAVDVRRGPGGGDPAGTGTDVGESAVPGPVAADPGGRTAVPAPHQPRA